MTANKRRSIFITDDLWGKIKDCAAREDRRVSSWIRRVLEAAAKKVLKGGR